MMTRTSCPLTQLFNRTTLCAALSLSVLGSANAITLSRPVVQSKQGEALYAEIDIPEISPVEKIDLEASLAGPDVYRAARIELPTSNGTPIDIQVQLALRSNGRPYLKITSTQSIQTDALDLLLDIRWATGRLLRDISLSLDDGKAPKSAALSNASTQQINVKRGDTASGLVGSVTPEGVSLEQMLLALLRNNPEAFVNDNVNRLKAGALVTLPTEDQVRAISAEQAQREIRVQAKDFQAYKAELAARAPEGHVAQASRDVAGKLDAKIDNKNIKSGQDKLTLAKPTKGKGEAEDKIAKQREAQEVASRAAEISRNIAELEKIAAATVASAAESAPVADVQSNASAPQDSAAWLDELINDPNTPIGAGALIAVLLLIAVWRRRAAKQDAASDIEGLPPLNVKFDLDLPAHDALNTEAHGHTEEVMTHADAHHEHPHDHDHVPHHAEPGLNEEAHDDSLQTVRPTLEMPDISLDLDETPVNDHPFQVRMDLADELWKLGQLHTSRALMEEVANEASGAVKEKALQWLAERG